MSTNEKSVLGAIQNTSLKNHSINAGGENQSDFVFDFATKTVEKQECEKCHPHLAAKAKRGARIKLCADCAGQTETTATAIFENIAAPRKVVRLQKCSGCGECKAPSKFSVFYSICKKCLSDNQGKSKLAQSNFIARAMNNFHKNLRGALLNV